ncbi:MAG: GHKL domain-containing protein [Lachnospiraceae bacterium]|nr:GHKL domain-containing protein [Lachnospiraceae bacterium]
MEIMVLTMLYQGLVLIADYSMLLIFGKIFPPFSEDMLNYSGISMLISIICKVFLLLIILILKRNIGHKSGDMLTDLEWLRLLFIPIITIVSLTAIMLKFNILQNMNQDYVLMYVALGMAGMNIVVFYLINDILEREMVIRNERLFHERIKNETDMYYSISENLDKQRKRTHEFKNQIAYIFALANSENYLELKDYIVKLDNDLKLSMDMVDTNNVIVNAILNTKYREALNKKIVFVLKVNDLSKIVLSDADIVVILSNLLNNAIEACETCENKVIKFKFVLEDNQTKIAVKNSFSKMPIRNNQSFISIKEKPEEHGMGIHNVIEAIKRYDGRYVIDYDKDIFSFSILITDNK